ncbi:sulfate adenylyltransferase, partial [mine drainage metagenome]
SYYGPFEAQAIFKEIPEGALQLRPMFFDLTFYCRGCDGMASSRTCPHDPGQRLLISGTDLRRLLSLGDEVPEHFSRPEVLDILREHYLGLAQESGPANSDRPPANPAQTPDQRRT